MTRPRREPVDCPIHCGRRMVLLFSHDGRAFYGCASYPACRHTERENVVEPDWFGKNKAKDEGSHK